MSRNLEINVGETVIYEDGFNSIPHITKVGRLTNTQIVCEGFKFNRKTGYLIGNKDSWRRPRIHVPREGEIEAISKAKRKSELVFFLHKQNWGFHTLEVLELVAAQVPIKDGK